MAKFIEKTGFRRRLETEKITPALEKTTDYLSAVLRDVIESAIFFWPNETQRRNGSVAGSKRDIVDTGEFRDSQTIREVKPNNKGILSVYGGQSTLKRYEIYWAAAYSVLILLGGVSRADGTETPGRDWIDAGLGSVDLAAIFARYFRL